MALYLTDGDGRKQGWDEEQASGPHDVWGWPGSRSGGTSCWAQTGLRRAVFVTAQCSWHHTGLRNDTDMICSLGCHIKTSSNASSLCAGRLGEMHFIFIFFCKKSPAQICNSLPSCYKSTTCLCKIAVSDNNSASWSLPVSPSNNKVLLRTLRSKGKIFPRHPSTLFT